MHLKVEHLTLEHVYVLYAIIKTINIHNIGTYIYKFITIWRYLLPFGKFVRYTLT